MAQKFHRQPLLDRLRKQSIQLLRLADSSCPPAELRLPLNFIDDLTQCLDAEDRRQLAPCLNLLSRVTFAQQAAKRHEARDLRLYILWGRAHSKRSDADPESNRFIEANLLKAASVVISSPTTPELVKRSVKGDTLPIVLRQYIDAGLTPPAEFVDSIARYSRPLSDSDVVTLAERLLERTHDEVWAYLIPVYPQLLKCLLILNYGGDEFLNRLWLACDKWPSLSDLVLGFAYTIPDDVARRTIFGKTIDMPAQSVTRR